MLKSPDATHLGQLLRSLLQNPHNFSEVAPEVRPAVHTAALRLISEEVVGVPLEGHSGLEQFRVT